MDTSEADFGEKKTDCQDTEDSRKLTVEGQAVKHDNSQDGEGEVDEVKEDPLSRSVRYLEQHRVIRLFQNLAAEVVYKRPENPLEFIANKLQANQEAKERVQGEEETTDADQFNDLLS